MHNKNNEALGELIAKTANMYFIKEGDRTSLMSVQRVEISNDGNKASLFLSIIPEDRIRAGLSFADRSAGKIRGQIIHNMPGRKIPFLNFIHDKGEINRQKVNEALMEK